MTKTPPLMGKENRKYIAHVFGSHNGTVRAIANKFDRQRAQARIRYQERGEANWRRELFASYGSADGALEGVPADRRDDALTALHHSFADVQAECRDLNKRPALLTRDRAELLKVWS